MSQDNFKKAALVGIAAAMLMATGGCSNSLTAGGLGGTTVTRLDTGELPGPEGQLRSI
jgi:polysaccharide export outer membrane protein